MASHKKVAILAFVARSFKILSGPVLLIVISSSISEEEMAFYFTFFSIVAFKQLVELGIGYTLKQFSAHAYHTDSDGNWKDSSKQKIGGYFKFGKIWFGIVSLFMLIVIGIGGIAFFDDYNGEVEWLGAWISLVIVLSIFLMLMPLQVILEGVQRQHSVYKARLYYGLSNSLSLIVCLSSGMGLYSIAISSFLANVTLYSTLYRDAVWLNCSLSKSAPLDTFSLVFKELWPVSSRVSVVWGFGFFFWNSFNLISFKVFDTVTAGKLAFSLAIAKAGYSISESILASQLTYFSNMIADGKVKAALKRFTGFRRISILISVVGFSFAIVILEEFPKFYFFEKMVAPYEFIQIALFYTLLLILTSENNFVRCFKVEPFVGISAFHSVLVPVSFLLGALYLGDNYFWGSSIVILISIFLSKRVAKEYF